MPPLRPAVEPHVAGQALGVYLELYSNAPNTFDNATVTIDVADDADGKPLITAEARLVPGQTGATRQVSGVIPTNVLPPGRYVARARITQGGSPAGVLSRPFVIERAASTAVTASARMEAAKAFAATLPAFDRQVVLERGFVAGLLDIVEKRSPTLKDAVTEARAGRYRRRGARGVRSRRSDRGRVPEGPGPVLEGRVGPGGHAAPDRVRRQTRVLPGRVLSRRHLRRAGA